MKKYLTIMVLIFTFPSIPKAQVALKQPIVSFGHKYEDYDDNNNKYYIDYKTSITSTTLQNNLYQIHHFGKEGFYDILKEKWVLSFKNPNTITYCDYNRSLNQILIFSKQKILYPYMYKATAKQKLWAKKMGKSNYIINDSIFNG